MRQHIISAGVKQLRESYPGVNESNIMTDQIYSAFFKASLEETRDACPATVKGRSLRREVEKVLKELEGK
jgi:hypothetical protein